MMSTIYYLLREIIQPYPLMLLLVGSVLAWAWRCRYGSLRWRLVSAGAFALIWVASTPTIGYWSMRSMERLFPPLAQRPSDADAIVILSGDFYAPTPGAPDQPVIGQATMYRCLEGARLYRQGPSIPIVLTGGISETFPLRESFAEYCARFMTQIGIPRIDLVLEEKSQTTFENALYSAQIAQERGWERIVLVTSATHMWRSQLAFRKQGLEVVCAPCKFRGHSTPPGVKRFLPDPRALIDLHESFHEWGGLVWYWLRGRVQHVEPR